MTNPNSQSLTRVTLATLANYRVAATQAVVAYRLGTRRLVRMVDGVLANVVAPRTVKLAPRATRRMNEMRGNVAGLVVKGIDRMAARTEKAIKAGESTAAAQWGKAAGFAADIESPIVAGGLRTALRLTLPGAKVALALSGKVAEGASALAGAAGGANVEKTVRAAGVRVGRAAGKAAQGATATVKTAARRVAKVPAKATRARAAKKPTAA